MLGLCKMKIVVVCIWVVGSSFEQAVKRWPYMGSSGECALHGHHRVLLQRASFTKQHNLASVLLQPSFVVTARVARAEKEDRDAGLSWSALSRGLVVVVVVDVTVLGRSRDLCARYGRKC